ncbi:histidine phosphatase family protein, partial [Candidatus Bathyarchaeota archaeon]|nr:histidine phosphatase family protein [Candidatus Bathyarchaeota archaeon]
MAKPRLIIVVRHAQSEGNSTTPLPSSCPSREVPHEQPSAQQRPAHSPLTPLPPENRDIHQTIPDHRVKLTPLGWNQAHDAGRRLRAMLRPTDKLHFFTSPYRRTRETAEGILETLTATDDDSPDGPSPFRRDKIKVYEEPRLREQDFGNFQPCGAEMERMWQE